MLPFTAAPVHLQQDVFTVVDRLDEVESAASAGAATEEHGPNTFEIAVERISGLGPQAHKVWLPPLKWPNPLDSLCGDLVVDEQLGLISPAWREAGNFTIPIGVAGVPREQRREFVSVSLSGAQGHVAIAGAPLSGKSTLARTIVAGLALTYTPWEVNMFVIDCGGGSFVGMSGLPHIAGVATRSDAEAVRRTLAQITDILDAREQFFRDNGIDSNDTYRRRRAVGEVDDGSGEVFLVIDGWTTFRGDYESLEPAVTALVQRGLTYGVHVILTLPRSRNPR